MRWLILLAVAGLAAANDFQLGDQIVATENECQRILKLNDNWRTSDFHEQAVQYVDLYFICLDSLNEDKYKYIDSNQVDLSWYPGENDKMPIITSEGEKYVAKPPQRKPKEEESMKKKLAEFITHTGGKNNPIYRLMSIQSSMSQVIVDKQVECEILALIIPKHPEDKNSETQHTDCMNKLNCLKEKFMDQHKFTREQYPDYFPILYKRRGTMIKTPPKLENSICETSDSPEGNKRELEKWMSGIEFIGEKLTNIGEAGTDFIEKLVKKGMGGGDKVLTRSELDEIMTDVQSVEISDDNGEDDEDDEHTYKVYGDLMISKLAELEAKGVQIAHTQLQKVEKAAKEKVENIASATGEQLKKLEEVKIKPAIKKTAGGITYAETNIKEKSKSALGEVKDGLSAAKNVAKLASSKAKEGSSTLMAKLKSNPNEDVVDENETEFSKEHGKEHEIASRTAQSWLSTLIDHMIQPEYLPDSYGDTHAPSLLNILKEMGGYEGDGKDKKTDEELVNMLKSLKESTKKRAQDLNLSKDEIKQSAEVVKGVMHALLYAASHGYGAASDMKPQEINKAKSRVDELVDYATAEVLGEEDGNEEEKEGSSDEDDALYKHTVVKKVIKSAPVDVNQEKETSEQITDQDRDGSPTAGTDTPIEVDLSESDSDEGKDKPAVPDNKQEVPDIK